MPRPHPRPHPAWPARCCAWALAVASTLLLCGCAALFGSNTPPAKEANDLEIQIEAAALLNPDDNNRPSPLLVRIYELRNEALFQEADFFSLYNTDKTVLQGDMLTVDQFILRPGESRSLRRKSNLQAGVVGVLAAYRDLPNATWRALVKLPAARDLRWYSPLIRDEKIRLRVQLQGKVVSIIDLGTGLNTEPPANTPTRGANAAGNTPSAGAQAAQRSPTAPAAGATLPSKEELLQHGQTLQDALKLLPSK